MEKSCGDLRIWTTCGKQNVDEVMAVWYPSHQLIQILKMHQLTRFAEAKNKVVKHAVIHRSDPYTVER